MCQQAGATQKPFGLFLRQKDGLGSRFARFESSPGSHASSDAHKNQDIVLASLGASPVPGESLKPFGLFSCQEIDIYSNII